MGGSDTTQTTQSQSVQQLPPWINQAAQQNYGFAQNVAEQPLQQYQGQMVADVSPQLQQSWNTAATGGGVGQDQYNASQAGLLGVMGQQPQQVSSQPVTAGQLSNTNLQSYMSPYTNSVINSTLPIMQQQNALNQNQIGNQANSANAFGGSRQGIQQGVAQAQGAQNIGQMAAQLNQANFQQAQQGAQFDVGQGNQMGQFNAGQNQAAQQANQAAQQNQGNLNLQAASGLGALGNQAQLSQARNFTEQMTAGQMQQGQAQNQINAQISKFQNANNYPNQQLSILQSALGMTPYEQGQQGSSTTQTQTAANPAQMALGGLSTLGSMFAAPAGGTSAMAGIGSFLGGMSDRRMKTDITKVGSKMGVPIHAYRYKGDPKSYPKVVGPMAEDVAKTFGPGSVAKIPGSGGKMAVHPAVMGALAGPAMGPPVPAGAMGGPRMPGPNLAAIAGARPPMGAMAPPVPAAAMGGPQMPGPNLGAIAAGGQGPLAAPKMIRPRRMRVAMAQPREPCRLADGDRPQYQYGTGTIGGSQFHWGSGTPGKYWSIPYGDYPVTPDAPTGAWAHQAGAIPIANNVIPDPQLGRNRIGIMIHSGSSDSLDQLYTQGCFKVAPQEWPGVRAEILKEADNGPLYLHVQPGGVAAFTNTKTFSQASSDTPAANANAAANTTANAPSQSAQGTTINSTGPGRPATPTPTQTPMFAGLNPDARGMRNNNPGNLVDNAWTQSLPGYKGSDGKFAIFDTPQHGAGALDQNLAHYGTQGINTPIGIASTWAPASDNNDPNSYGAQIAKSLGVGLNDKININDPAVRSKVGQAIGLVENGPGKSPGFAVGVGAPTASTTATTPGTTINSTPATAAAPAGVSQGQQTQLAQNVKKMLGLPDDDSQGQQQIEPSKMIGPQPQARNVSTLLGGPGGIGQGQVSPAYAQRMDALNQPLTWGAAPPGQMPGTGYGMQQQPSVFGTSLMSNLGRSLDPMWMNSWGT